MVLCKEHLENKELRQGQVLAHERGSDTEDLQDHASPEAWKLHVLLVASEALQLSRGIRTRAWTPCL